MLCFVTCRYALCHFRQVMKQIQYMHHLLHRKHYGPRRRLLSNWHWHKLKLMFMAAEQMMVLTLVTE
jgi:hypothetical protein